MLEPKRRGLEGGDIPANFGTVRHGFGPVQGVKEAPWRTEKLILPARSKNKFTCV